MMFQSNKNQVLSYTINHENERNTTKNNTKNHQNLAQLFQLHVCLTVIFLYIQFPLKKILNKLKSLVKNRKRIKNLSLAQTKKLSDQPYVYFIHVHNI